MFHFPASQIFHREAPPPLAPRQLRLIFPMTRQPPVVRLMLVAAALAIGPLCVVEAAIEGYHDVFFAVLHPKGRGESRGEST